MDAKLQGDLQAAKNEVLAHPEYQLAFETRQRVLLDLGPVQRDEKGQYAVIGLGLIRRTRLCIACVRRVLPGWESYYDTRDPHTILELAEAYLRQEIDRKKVQQKAYSFRGGLDSTDIQSKDIPFCAGMAAVAAGFTAIMDETLEPRKGISLEQLHDPDDPDQWDCAFWAAAAHAGGMPWATGFDKNRYRDFWIWYLDQAIPNTL